MAESDPRIMVRLVALNERTRQAWADPHNKSFYVPASFAGVKAHAGRVRESTPFQEIDEVGAKENEPEIRISLTNRPKNISKGWMFGRDRSTCDVYCGECDTARKYNIGGQTFSLTISKQGNVLLKHVNNQNQTEVQYRFQKAGTRREFIWIMFPDCEEIVVTSANHLQFKVIVTKPDAQTKLYKQLQALFLKDAEKSTQSIPSLNADSGTITAKISLVSRPKMRPFYYRREGKELGRGAFGKVEVVVDASTGVEYAGKTFFGDINQREIDILAKQKHENILRYVTLSTDDGPLLVTDYLRGGNLARPWRLKDREPWRHEQIISILIQILRGLANLHARPNPVIHRDIKPANILVEDCERGADPREPGPWIKLADFGLAVQGTKCEGLAGTFSYAAPEAYGIESNVSKGDIWSVGVVIMELLLNGNLPNPSTRNVHGPSWCEDVQHEAARNIKLCKGQDQQRGGEGRSSVRTVLWDFITRAMLQWHPNERLSAQECLDDPTLKLLQSKAIAMAEEQLKKAVQQLSASSSNSKANDQEEQIPTHIDTDYASNLTRDSFFDSSGNFDSGVSQYSPGAVAWRDQGVSGSRTPVPPHLRSESEYQQPIPYGLVLVGNSGNGPKSQHEVEVDEPTLKPYQRSKTGPIASCKGKGPKIRHEVEGDEPTAKPSQRSKAGSTRPRRNLQTDKVRAFSPSGLSVAGPHRTPSQRKRSSSLISKRPASSSAARHRRGSSTSEQATEQAAAHALMGLKKCTH